jgi:signal transduction histidine kinase
MTALGLAADVALRLAGASDDELDGVVTETLELLADRSQADRTYVTLYYDDGTFEVSHEWTRNSVVPQRHVIQQMRSNDFAYTYDMAARHDVFSAPDLALLPDAAAAEKRSFSSFGVRAVLQVPIVMNGECVGLVGFNDFQVRDEWSPDLIEFTRTIGQAIGVALHRQRSAQAIRRAYEVADRANKAKSALLAHFSHELRTPLHAMLGYAELLSLDTAHERDREALHEIQLNGKHLLSLVDDLLAIAGGAEDELEPVAIGPEIEQIVSGLEQATTSRGVAITTENVSAAPHVVVEPARLRQVISCALSGAVQAMGSSGAIVIDADPNIAGLVTLRLSSSTQLRQPGMVLPLAGALLEGHGSIELAVRSEHSANVTIRFDQPAKP